MKQGIALHINGNIHEVLVSPNQTLLEVLRGKVGLTGTKRGCDLGACGACTVLVDGEAYLSCLMLAVDAVGKNLVTTEGLSHEDEFHFLQKAIEIETDDLVGPFGAKESGEGTQLAPAPAIVKAIYDAFGIDFNELPVTPEHILKALRNKHRKAGSRGNS